LRAEDERGLGHRQQAAGAASIQFLTALVLRPLNGR
jgi:hypothetical protein